MKILTSPIAKQDLIKESTNYCSRGVEDPETREKIKQVVQKWLK